MIDDEKAKENCVNEGHDGTYCDHQHSTALLKHCIAEYYQMILMYAEECSPQNCVIEAEYPIRGVQICNVYIRGHN